MNKYNYTKISPFRWFVLENFPFIEDDFDALTNWQLFCKIGKEINKIINSQNELGEEMENVVNAFINLQNYVTNYFDNLDVQDEINNKLDEMTEDGTLESILLNYTSIIKTYNTFSDLLIDKNNLINGMKVQTLGYNTINDGGKAIYYITNTSNNNIFQVDLQNGLYANLIGKLTPENTNLTLDQLLNNYFEFDFDIISEKIYNISNPINITSTKYFDFKNITINYTGENTINELFNYGYDYEEISTNVYSGFKNLKIKGNSKVGTVCHISGGKGIDIQNLKIDTPLTYGLLCDSDKGQLWELSLDNIYVSGTNNIGMCDIPIKIGAITDSHFNNIYATNGSLAWLESSAATCTFNNLHGYAYPNENDYLPEKGFIFKGNGNQITNIMVDTPNLLGIDVQGNYNIFTNISLANQHGGIGIKDSDSNIYDNIAVGSSVVLESIIESNSSNMLVVKNIKNTQQASYDIKLLRETLPFNFRYDCSGNASNYLRKNFRFLNQAIYTPNSELEIALPIPFRNTDYNVNVIVNRNAFTPLKIVKATDKITIKIDRDNIGTDSVIFDVYCELFKPF